MRAARRSTCYRTRLQDSACYPDLVNTFHDTIVRARDEGVVELPERGASVDGEALDRLGRLLGQLSPEVLAEALQRGDALRREA